ncbi:MAG: hypothetical protein HOW73_33435 [Polyangiaceae bacterium]|nr:hypothetical protein [Polyangiaceae bacterium]
MKDLAELVELNRFVGREFLLWLWFESELYETNLRPTNADACALWLESELTLASEAEETRVKSSTPGLAPEAKQALRQGKLPKQTKLRLVWGELEYGWKMNADTLAIASLKIPAQLKSQDDKYEALYERMRLTESLETILDALYADFITLRLDVAWENVIVPQMRRWARGQPVEEGKYAAAKAKLKRTKTSAKKGASLEGQVAQ